MLSETVSYNTNINNLYIDKFKFVLQGIPNTIFMCSDVSLPSISTNPQQLPTPHGNVFKTGSKVEFSNFSITFRVDEDLKNYKEIYNWITKQGVSMGYEEHNQFSDSRNGLKIGVFNKDNFYSDGTLVTLKNTHVLNIAVRFTNLFPVALSEIRFGMGDNQPATCTATFVFTQFLFDDYDNFS